MPSQRLVDWTKRALPYRVTVDSLGYRGTEFPRDKPRGAVRLLVTGDSFTFGDFVDDSQTLPAQLEGQLRSRCARVEVINAGLSGATITDEAMMIERALPLHPDLVVLVFSENDVTDLAGTQLWQQLAANRRAKSHFPLSLVYPVLRRSALWNLALMVGARFRASRASRAASDGPVAGKDVAIARLGETYRRALIGVRDEMAARGVRLVFVVFPSHYSVTAPARDSQTNWAARVGIEAGIPTFNLLTPLRAADLPADRLYLLPSDGHPSARGYAIVARYLAERLSLIHPLVPVCHRGFRSP